MTRTSKIIVGGFLVRAFVGQVLFWISYLRLPFGRSLQLGDGFWFFALDGPTYMRLANTVAERGVAGIFTLTGPVPSQLFIRLLTVLVLVFGSVASLAILINCAAYALTCTLLVRLSAEHNAKNVLVAAIAFSPAAMLFSSQLLKDTFFCFLIVLMAAIFQRWQESWRTDGPYRQLLTCAAAMFLVVYALSGIRWYFAAIVWGASAIFLLQVSWQARRRRLALAMSAILFVLLSQAVRVGSLDLPRQIARMLNPVTVFQSTPLALPKLVATARRGFETTPAATTIAPGWLVAASGSKAGSSYTTIPQTVLTRLITGLSATFLPRFVAQPLGLIRVDGGRGFWLFAEVDTIVFGGVVLYVAIWCVRSLLRGSVRVTPLFVFLVLVFMIAGGSMVYTVNNFGTLFRLRQMLYVVAAVIPVTLRRVEEEKNRAF